MAAVEFNCHVVLVGDEVRRQESAIELHALDHINKCFCTTAFFNRDHTVLADFQEGVGQHVSDRRIVVASDRRDLLNLFFVLLVDRRGLLGDRCRDRLGGL